MKTLEQTIEQMKLEILEHVVQGRVPKTVASFSELHDYVDANCYGSFCDDDYADAMIEHFGGRDKHEGMPDGFMQYMNDAQNAIDVWLRSGGIEL